MNMRLHLLAILAAISTFSLGADKPSPPNIVIIFADDLGYGDLGCFGHPTIATPEIDRMAREGTRLTQFYVAESVCTPSRAGLLTGRLPQRSGMYGDKRRVLFPDSLHGLPTSEMTLARYLKQAGYATGCFGKWHLGHRPEFLPTKHGFDRYLGIPYSNDMDRVASAPKGRAAFDLPRSEYWNSPFISAVAGQSPTELERSADQTQLTRRYTEAAMEFIEQHRSQPFFVYLPHHMPHVPLFRSAEFAERSRRGLYGDVVEELDWSVGQILGRLRKLQLQQQTLVIFTSDNGPWLVFDSQGGSAGLLREGKGSTFEGGMRVPAVVWWPETIPAGTTNAELTSTLDLLPTCCKLAGVEPNKEIYLDGYDLSKMLIAGEKSPRKEMFFYRGSQLMAARLGAYKAHYFTQGGYGPDSGQAKPHDPPLLYNVEHDPSEKWDVAANHPDVLQQIAQRIQQHHQTHPVAASQLD
jgi:arylsulfatase A